MLLLTMSGLVAVLPTSSSYAAPSRGSIVVAAGRAPALGRQLTQPSRPEAPARTDVPVAPKPPSSPVPLTGWVVLVAIVALGAVAWRRRVPASAARGRAGRLAEPVEDEDADTVAH